MDKLINFEETRWIFDELDTSHYSQGMTVKHVIPPRFLKYGKILQPLFRDNLIKNESLTFEDCRDSDLDEMDLGEKFTYKDIACKYGMPYDSEITTATFISFFGGSLPCYLITSEEGDLDRGIVESLVILLREFTGGKCYFYYAPNSWVNEELLFYGKLTELIALINEVGSFPTYCWSEERSWCIHMNYNVDFALIGGQKQLIDQLANSDIEMFKIEYSDIVLKYR
ncbi:hypothetical protein GMD78_10850 [Ornithinibacillus sp. L9]|uniref:Uncharacterized protein n=1 Tax=Ornithinibacillus caprae TaxID=2678566 RepID=A0A6N8FI35_9BACI|nr:hypothetical protein [Ornithinibacillus caprae]MUK88891.1 hypothetical protein [Ornithinibacillus caprae]